jgi:hypothetical protein
MSFHDSLSDFVVVVAGSASLSPLSLKTPYPLSETLSINSEQKIEMIFCSMSLIASPI